jgi:8-oxo-dGTP pyrophosphatase MutT (NUDIX family)
MSTQSLLERFAQPPQWQAEALQPVPGAARQPMEAAVLIPLLQPEPLSVLLTQRSTRLTHHSGQVAFPGGRMDPEDRNAVDTALREAEEEVGLQAHQVRVLGQLPSLLTGSAFRVTPVVALVDAEAPLQANPHEVAATFTVPLTFLMNPQQHRWHRLEWEQQGERLSREWLSMPYWDAQAGCERFIWGATAAMLRNLYRLLAA